MDINKAIKSIILDRGIKMTKVSDSTGIAYQRLNRIFNQGALLLATEFLELCEFLRLSPNAFCDCCQERR